MPMDRAAQDSGTRRSLMWAGIAAGAALGMLAVFYVFRERNPAHRMDHLLRRCEDRIHNIESSLAELESTLATPSG